MPSAITYARLAPDAARFWANVAITTDDDCWLWQGGASSNGYGQFHPRPLAQEVTRTIAAHRVAWMLANRSSLPPKGLKLVIDHLCETPRCCNPAHLALVTHRANVLAARQGRAVEVRVSKRGVTTFKVRFRADGKQTSRTFDTRDAAQRFSDSLRSGLLPRVAS